MLAASLRQATHVPTCARHMKAYRHPATAADAALSRPRARKRRLCSVAMTRTPNRDRMRRIVNAVHPAVVANVYPDEACLPSELTPAGRARPVSKGSYSRGRARCERLHRRRPCRPGVGRPPRRRSPGGSVSSSSHASFSLSLCDSAMRPSAKSFHASPGSSRSMRTLDRLPVRRRSASASSATLLEVSVAPARSAGIWRP
jgi:hypothetical protein